MDKSEFNIKLGSFIREKRLEKGWSQTDLADKLQNNFQNISRLERGEVSPTLFWCNQLAEVFEIELHIFLEDFSKESI